MKAKTKKRFKALEKEIARLDSIVHDKSQTPIRDAMAKEYHDQKIIDLDPEINWDKPGELVEYNNLIVMTSGKHTANVFTGMQINKSNAITAYRGKAASDYQKRLFKPSNAQIKFCYE